MPNIPLLHGKFVQGRAIPRNDASDDQFAFTDDLSFQDDPNFARVGEHSGVCIRVREAVGNDPGLYQCEATFKLPDGQVTARGLVAIPVPVGESNLFAISGGTDRYDNLRGDVKVTKRSPVKADYEFRTQG